MRTIAAISLLLLLQRDYIVAGHLVHLLARIHLTKRVGRSHSVYIGDGTDVLLVGHFGLLLLKQRGIRVRGLDGQIGHIVVQTGQIEVR